MTLQQLRKIEFEHREACAKKVIQLALGEDYDPYSGKMEKQVLYCLLLFSIPAEYWGKPEKFYKDYLAWVDTMRGTYDAEGCL